MREPNPIYFSQGDDLLYFVVTEKPWVQKNNFQIRYRNPRQKLGAFIDHGAEMKTARQRMSKLLYDQYCAQGRSHPIDYLISVDLVFYVKRGHEPDLDNLPAFVLDAMQGINVKGLKNLKVASILVDDKLVREEHSRKIVEGDIGYDGEPRTEITIRRYKDAR